MSVAKNRHDHYWRKAKKEGFLARAAYKLEALDRRFRLFRAGQRVLDIGCSPGSWTQYLLKRFSGGIQVVGIDRHLPQIGSLAGFEFIQGDLLDFCDSGRLAELGGRFSIVISDAAPDTSGHKSTDAYRSLELCEAIAHLASTVLAPGGSFVCKIFQSEAVSSFRSLLQSQFNSVTLVKPEASRKESREIYLVATGFRNESTID